MRSRVEILADVADDGRTVLARLQASGQLAVRPTGPAEVHLVGAAAGPLGGDAVEVVVEVRPGARLSVRGVAATLALPHRSGAEAVSVIDLEVGDGAVLDLALPPLVVCRGARLRTTTRLGLRGRAAADVTEQVVLGRYGEDGGDWTGRLVVDRDGLPVLRGTQRSEVVRGGPGRPGERPVRTLVTRFRTRGLPGRPAPATRGGAVASPLASGDVLVTALGGGLTTALCDAAAVLTDAAVGVLPG